MANDVTPMYVAESAAIVRCSALIQRHELSQRRQINDKRHSTGGKKKELPPAKKREG